MKKQIFSLVLTVFVGLSAHAAVNVQAVRIGESNPSVSAYVFGTGEQLSGQQFQTDGILTYQGYQYTVYYSLSRNVCIARRKMPVGNWEELMLPYKNSVNDAHNVITMGICAKDGSIHLAYDHHNDDLHYCYSKVGSANDPENMPWQASSFSATTNIMDKKVPDVTYPRFISMPNGNLLFECRFRWSGYGDSYLREYDGTTKKWTLIGRYVQGEDVQPDACAYINGMTYDNSGKLHVTWCWRDDFGGGSNHDFYYAYSEDDGRTWKDTHKNEVAATQFMEPVLNKVTGSALGQTKTSLMVEAIPFNRGYINQETQDVDSKGRIHAVNSHIPDGQGSDSNWGSSRQKARLHQRFRDTDGTWKKIQIKNNGNLVHSYCRVNLSFDAFDNAYVVANGAEVYAATDANGYQDWDLLSGVDAGRFLSEPLVDRPLLKNNGVLSFVYLGADKKITVIDYLTQNPNTPDGTGLLAEYFSDEAYTALISSETVATPDQSVIPAGTKSIRWSGTFETIKGEQYTLYVDASTETSVFVNSLQTAYIKPSGTTKEASFAYRLIPSHKNNIVIESKGSQAVSLSWSSAHTPKSLIPTTSLYPQKANGELGEVTPPVLEKKVSLDQVLMAQKKTIDGTSKDITVITPFDPPGEYSIEVKAKINAAAGRGLDIESRAKTGKGFRISLDETTVNLTTSLNSPQQIAFADNTQEQTYRFAVKDEKVHVFRGVQYIGTQQLDFIKEIQEDDTEAESAGTYGQDVIGNWAGPSGTGTGMPTAYGWSSSPVNAPWNTAGGGSGVRYETATHSVEGQTAYNGRFMTIRWDSDDLLSTHYFYKVSLEANTTYDFSLLYEYWSNASSSQPMTIGISTTNNASGIYDSKTFNTSATAQVLRPANFIFTSKEAGTYYLTFAGARAMYGIANLSLKSFTYENKLQIGKNYATGHLDAEIAYVSYQPGAFAASEQEPIIEVPNLPEKAILPDELQDAVVIQAGSGTKEIYNLPFNPTGDYSVEVAATITSATGRGLDIEARSEDGLGFRTAMSANSFNQAAPFNAEYLPEISATDNTAKQVIRYAVQADKVHIYQQGEFVKSLDITAVGNMNQAGTVELSTAKNIGVKDAENLFNNGDFSTDAHGAAPAGWLSEKTMGGGTQSRVQQKENTTELTNYPDGTKAFVFRFDNDAEYGTWYSFPAMLKADAWYEYSFDIIAWGVNTNQSFKTVVSTQQDGKSGIIYEETITTPSVGKNITRPVLRFKTPAGGSGMTQYYFTFAKIASVGSIGSTNFTLVENNINNLLFGKNYTAGATDITVHSISADFTGAFAPGENDDTVTPEYKVENACRISTENGHIHISSQSVIKYVEIYDVLGKKHFSQQVNSQTHLMDISLTQGLYVVIVESEMGRTIKKVLL
jgi:hypothetical protein